MNQYPQPHVLQEQIEALQRELEARDESLFEMQATLVAVQAETQHKMQQHTDESSQVVRSLQEQLRRAQQEANLARSSAARQQHQQPQQQPRPVISPTERLVRSIPQQPRAVYSKTQKPQQQQHAAKPQIRTIHTITSQPSSGERLAQYLLRSTAAFSAGVNDDCGGDAVNTLTDAAPPSSCYYYYSQLLLTLSHVAAAGPSQSTPATTTAVVSELDVVWWLVLELVSISSVALATGHVDADQTSSSSDAAAAMDIGDETNTNRGFSAETQRHEQSPAAASHRCFLLLTWLHDALAYSPAASQFLLQAVSSSALSSECSADESANVHSKRRRRTSCIRIVTVEEQHAAKTAATTNRFVQVERELRNPLWVPVNDDSTTPTDVANEPTPIQCQCACRFLQELCYEYALGRTDAISVTAMQIIVLLLSRCAASERSVHCLCPNDFLDAVLRVWSTAASHLVKAKRPHAADSRNKPSSVELAIPLRLLQLECLKAPADSSVATAHAKPSPSHISLSSDALTEGSSSKHLLTWMAESLHLLRMVWNHSSTTMRQSWATTARASSLLAAVLDVLEHVVLPDNDLHSHPATEECISWLQELASQCRLATVDDRMTTKRCLMLLRTQQATSKSTAELWHFAPTAIAVSVQLFHRVVIRQHMDDHLPASPVAMAAVELSPVRDQLVRFFHGILEAVQEDRRLWVQEQENKTSGSKKQAISFMAVLSECFDLYTSSAALLLSIPEDGISYCKAHPDIRAMLKVQMNELADDQLDKNVTDTGE